MFRRSEVIWSKFVSWLEHLFDPLETKVADNYSKISNKVKTDVLTRTVVYVTLVQPNRVE